MLYDFEPVYIVLLIEIRQSAGLVLKKVIRITMI